jgi:phage shock protein A
MFDRFVNFVRSLFGALLGKVEDPQLLLNQTYEDLRMSLIQVQQAVAQALAVQKQIELQLKKDQEQIQTWHNRAAMAVQQGKDDLAKQALQRKQQFTQSANERSGLLKNQQEAVQALQKRLLELEAEVERAKSKKDVLIARDKVAQATSKANELLSKTTTNSVLSVMDRMEEKVQEREAKSAALAQMNSDSLENQFKSIENKSDVDDDLAALKNELGMGGPTKIEIREPVLLEEKAESTKNVEAEVRDVSDS